MIQKKIVDRLIAGKKLKWVVTIIRGRIHYLGQGGGTYPVVGTYPG